MSTLLAFTSEDGSAVLVEATDASTGPVMRSGRPGAAVVEATESLEDVVARIGPVVKGIVAGIRESAGRPEQIEVEFAVTIAADSNLVIARASGEANFRVQLRWGGPKVE
ncbi:CU044_2847 family protein [Demequina rhizosphaerae]|uniref:CU044_2847 family protein n=1 Tax=Demequina rhizosphaerae TaxID=1638985 RepID=UPI000782C314|nr:CU044_2847 family protein [Demequina rhizosphaerae]